MYGSGTNSAFAPAPGPACRTRLGRALGFVSEVRPGEGRAAAYLAACVFLLLCTYHLLKPTRDGMLAASTVGLWTKAEIKAYAGLVQGLVLLVVVPCYSRLAERWPRRVLLARVNTFFAAQLGALWLLHPGVLFERIAWFGIVFYVWVGIFNLAVLAQFWSIAGELCGEERGRRLFPIFGLSASGGGVAGAWCASRLAMSESMSTHSLLLAALVCLFAATLAIRAASSSRSSDLAASFVGDRAAAYICEPAAPSVGGCAAVYGGIPDASAAPASSIASPTPSGRREGGRAWSRLFTNKYLLAAALVVTVVNWVSTTGETLLYASVQSVVESRLAQAAITDPAAVERFVADTTTAFYGSFFFWTNLVALVLQALVVSRVIRLGGFGLAVTAVPLVVLFAYAAAAFAPMLGVLKVLKIVENATLHSVSSTANRMMWLPAGGSLEREAKALVETVCVRLGDVLAAVTLYVSTHMLGLSTSGLYVFNVFLGVLWLGAAAMLAREHKRIVDAARA